MEGLVAGLDGRYRPIKSGASVTFCQTVASTDAIGFEVVKMMERYKLTEFKILASRGVMR